MAMPTFSAGGWAADFEFYPAQGLAGNPVKPVCLVVSELSSGATRRFWWDELATMRQAPFPVGPDALFVAFFASAEMACFIALGWALPANVLDLFTEFRCLTNGRQAIEKHSLLVALRHFGLPALAAAEKRSMIDLILTGGPWTLEQRLAILDYCESDVAALAALLPAMEDEIDLPRALVRGRYMKSVARIETDGVPIDLDLHTKLVANWDSIKTRLIDEVDRDFGVFVNHSFNGAKFEAYLARTNIAWPRLQSGALDLDADAFKYMALVHTALDPLRELRSSLGKMRLTGLTVGIDGRNRCLLSPFRSTTGRNQPSPSWFIFGPSRWMRGLIKPKEGRGLAYLDWKQQEFGIAAALSGDQNMIEAYRSGDPYMAFALQAGAVPVGATQLTHEAERDQFKACVLAVQYGMGAHSLTLRINQPTARASQLLELHRRTYPTFWAFSDDVVNEALLGGRLWTSFRWDLHATDDPKGPNGRSLRNFPMQAHGAEMLRIACILMHEAGIQICAPVHDALLIEAPLDQLDMVVAQAQDLMRQASKIVLKGFELTSDVKIVRYPDRYMDKRGTDMWNRVMHLIGEPPYTPPLAA